MQALGMLLQSLCVLMCTAPAVLRRPCFLVCSISLGLTLFLHPILQGSLNCEGRDLIKNIPLRSVYLKVFHSLHNVWAVGLCSGSHVLQDKLLQ